MKLSIVTTMYCSAPYLQEFYSRISRSAKKITDDYEIIFVNDGSPDNALEIALIFYESDSKVRVIDLSRNFGHHKAIITGLCHAEGEKVFLIDCDLEEEPELLERFNLEFINARDVDVTFGVQKSRKGSFFEKVTGAFFYNLFNYLSEHKIPANLTTVRLMSKRYVESLIKHDERELLLAGLWVLTGFKQLPLFIDKLQNNSSTYSFNKKLSILVNSITSFSNKPLYIIFYTGFLIFFLSCTFISVLIFRKLFFNAPIPGYTSLIVSIWFSGGMVIFSLGVIGIYLSKVFMEVKRRPYTIVRSIYKAREEETKTGEVK